MIHDDVLKPLAGVRVDDRSAAPVPRSSESAHGVKTNTDERAAPDKASAAEIEPPDSRLAAADLRLTHRLESIVAGAGAFSNYRSGRIRSTE